MVVFVAGGEVNGFEAGGLFPAGGEVKGPLFGSTVVAVLLLAGGEENGPFVGSTVVVVEVLVGAVNGPGMADVGLSIDFYSA